ncbi:Transcriptional regulator, LuxR family [Burkholderiales bacterium 8X]|nr:Transcriptional regulator, LuxR family [Burkholderiales bacterium 8X]
MKRWPIRNQDPSVASSTTLAMLAGIGTTRLARHFLDALSPLLPVTFCTVFAVGASGRIETVSAASSYGDTAERTAKRYVAQRFDLLDPNMAWLSARKKPRHSQLWLGHQHAEEVADPAYRAACYGDVGIRERASILLLRPSGQRAAVSFYRSLAQPDFTTIDFDLLERHAALLAEATMAHGRTVAARPVEDEPAFAERLLELSPREREVMAHLLRGLTAKEIAREMAIGLTTVRTHQYRGFKRLGVASLRQLLLASRSNLAG